MPDKNEWVPLLIARKVQPCSRSLRRGFTLFELVAVGLLLGLIATVAAVGFGRSYHLAEQRRVLETWLFYDQQCRTLSARSSQKTWLVYQPEEGVVLRSTNESNEQMVLTREVSGLQIRNLEVSGQNRIRYTCGGRSDSYLIQHGKLFTLVIGSTGQTFAVADLSEAERLIGE